EQQNHHHLHAFGICICDNTSQDYVQRFRSKNPYVYFGCWCQKRRLVFRHCSDAQAERWILRLHQPKSELQQAVCGRMDLCQWNL
ncbi:hypothetical protein QVD17_21372, partial [Tagetes erecta]